MKRIITVLLLFIALHAGALDLISPLPGREGVDWEETSAFGMRKDRRNPAGGALDSFHRGRDLRGPIGVKVHAAAAGTVIEVWPPADGYHKGHPIYGGMVLIKHDEQTFTLYGHLRKIAIQEGWHVWQGRVIGEQGNTGISTGDHLHFEILTEPVMREQEPPPSALDIAIAKMIKAYLAQEAEDRNVTR